MLTQAIQPGPAHQTPNLNLMLSANETELTFPPLPNHQEEEEAEDISEPIDVEATFLNPLVEVQSKDYSKVTRIRKQKNLHTPLLRHRLQKR
jgi:hypothetical protein